MGIYLNPNTTRFQEALNSEIYVDKSELLKYTNKKIHTEQKYICVSRPPPFRQIYGGKHDDCLLQPWL